MQALSRNTASVAQDFPNAGGDTPRQQQQNQQQHKGMITVKSCKDINSSLLNRDFNDLYGAIGLQKSQHKIKAMSSPIDHSPPASQSINNNNSIKRRRKSSSSSSNDKENVNELLRKQLTFLKQQHHMFLENLNASMMSDGERLKAIFEINEIFEGMYRNSLTIISSIDENGGKIPKIEPKIKLEPVWADEEGGNEENEFRNYSLPAFLRNNKEITVIMDPKNGGRVKCHQNDSSSGSGCDEASSRKNRKQLKPKKIEKEFDDVQSQRNKGNVGQPKNHASSSSITTINNLRDKHMLKLVTKKRCCYICRNKSIDANSYYSKESLLLHNLWRHAPKLLECHRCQSRFNRIYKLKLHKTLKRH